MAGVCQLVERDEAEADSQGSVGGSHSALLLWWRASEKGVSELTLFFFPYKVADCMTRFVHLVPGTSLAPHTETLTDSTASVLGEFPLPS